MEFTRENLELLFCFTVWLLVVGFLAIVFIMVVQDYIDHKRKRAKDKYWITRLKKDGHLPPDWGE